MKNKLIMALFAANCLVSFNPAIAVDFINSTPHPIQFKLTERTEEYPSKNGNSYRVSLDCNQTHSIKFTEGCDRGIITDFIANGEFMAWGQVSDIIPPKDVAEPSSCIRSFHVINFEIGQVQQDFGNFIVAPIDGIALIQKDKNFFNEKEKEYKEYMFKNPLLTSNLLNYPFYDLNIITFNSN